MGNEYIFNHLKLKELLDIVFFDLSERDLEQFSGIHRNVLGNWKRGITKGGIREESWDKLINLFAKRNVCIRRADFYYLADEGYDHLSIPQNKIADPDSDKENIEGNNNEMISKEEYNRLMEAFKEAIQKVVDQNTLIKELQDEIKALKEENQQLKLKLTK